MKRNRSIRIKAAILLLVFSLNTIVGFACAIGLKKAFAPDHHDTKEVIHVHADGKKHIHYEKVETKPVVHIHADGKKHIHHEKPSNIPADIAGENNREEKSKCCTTKVSQFDQIDKYVPQSVKIDPVIFTTILTDFFNIDILYTSYINTNIKYFVRSYHPPIPNIRIAIQSFQI